MVTVCIWSTKKVTRCVTALYPPIAGQKSTLRDGNARQILTDILPKTMQSIWAGQPVALLAWLKNFEPETLQKARYIFMVKDLIRFYLTGEAFLELTDISGTNLINVRDCKYDDELLAWWGLDELRDKLPPSNAQQNAAEKSLTTWPV